MAHARVLLERLSAMSHPAPLEERTMVTRYGALIDLDWTPKAQLPDEDAETAPAAAGSPAPAVA